MITSRVNVFSNRWVRTFLETRNADQTELEARFIHSFVEPGSRVLDLACGYGRHAAALSSLGIDVVGADIDARMLEHARQSCPVVQADMRRLPFRNSSFAAVTIMWQSFGYFRGGENLAVLSDLRRMVRPGGVLILDLYNREYFEVRSKERSFVRAGTAVKEAIELEGDRLRVHLNYDDGADSEEFEWQIYSPRTLHDLATAAGWTLIGAHREFDLSKPPDPRHPMVQYVLSRATNP